MSRRGFRWNALRNRAQQCHQHDLLDRESAATGGTTPTGPRHSARAGARV